MSKDVQSIYEQMIKRSQAHNKPGMLARSKAMSRQFNLKRGGGAEGSALRPEEVRLGGKPQVSDQGKSVSSPARPASFLDEGGP